MTRATLEVAAALRAMPPHSDRATRAEEIRLTLRRFLRRELDRRPLILPVVLSV